MLQFRTALCLTTAVVILHTGSLALPPTALAGPPGWFRDAVNAAGPTTEGTRVLLREVRIEVKARGLIERRERRVIHIASKEAAEEAIARVHFREPGRTVKSLRAWLMDGEGRTNAYDRSAAVDLALLGESIYSESRLLTLSAADDATAGSVFGFESVVRFKPFYLQFDLWMQRDLPVDRSGVELEVPEGWQVAARWINHAGPDPNVERSTYRWALAGLEEPTIETAGPPLSALVPRLAITIIPDEESKLPGFTTWEDVSAWLGEYMRKEPGVQDVVRTRVEQIVAGAESRLDSVQRVARFVQDLRYASIDLGVQSGGGYVPSPPAEVLQHGYGDCKDKANLLRSMLALLGVESELVVVRSGDATYVQSEWPAAIQFNHCIVAIDASTAPDELQACPATLAADELLFFDPTDPEVPLGELPWHEWQSLGLILRSSSGELVRLPGAEPAANSRMRLVLMDVVADGTVEGLVRERLRGLLAADLRHTLSQYGETAVARTIARDLTAAYGAVQVSDVAALTGADESSIQLQYRINIPARSEYESMGLVLLRLCLDPFDDMLPGITSPRHHSIRVTPMLLRDSVVVRLPETVMIDETPSPVKFSTSFAHYQSRYHGGDRTLRFARVFEITESTVPASQAEALMTLVNDIGVNESSPVVLQAERSGD